MRDVLQASSARVSRSLQQAGCSRGKLQCVAAAPKDDFRDKAPKDVNVLVVGCTGYIGKFVTRELVKRGYNVVAFTRENAGIKGKLGKEDIKKVGSWPWMHDHHASCR